LAVGLKGEFPFQLLVLFTADRGPAYFLLSLLPKALSLNGIYFYSYVARNLLPTPSWIGIPTFNTNSDLHRTITFKTRIECEVHGVKLPGVYAPPLSRPWAPKPCHPQANVPFSPSDYAERPNDSLGA